MSRFSGFGFPTPFRLPPAKVPRPPAASVLSMWSGAVFSFRMEAPFSFPPSGMLPSLSVHPPAFPASAFPLPPGQGCPSVPLPPAPVRLQSASPARFPAARPASGRIPSGPPRPSRPPASPAACLQAAPPFPPRPAGKRRPPASAPPPSFPESRSSRSPCCGTAPSASPSASRGQAQGHSFPCPPRAPTLSADTPAVPSGRGIPAPAPPAL